MRRLPHWTEPELVEVLSQKGEPKHGKRPHGERLLSFSPLSTPLFSLKPCGVASKSIECKKNTFPFALLPQPSGTTIFRVSYTLHGGPRSLDALIGRRSSSPQPWQIVSSSSLASLEVGGSVWAYLASTPSVSFSLPLSLSHHQAMLS